MKFNNNKIFTIFIGLLVLALILPTVSSSLFGSDRIENNKTIDLNGVRLTVPNSDNFTINDSSTLDYYSYSKKNEEKLDLDKVDHFNSNGTAHEYFDAANQIRIMVINSSDVPYISADSDGEVVDSVELEGRIFQQQKTLNNKVVLVWVYEDNGQDLSKKIINSATVL